MNRFRKYRLSRELDTTATGKLLYLFLLDAVDANGKITISHRRIGETLGIKRGTVSRNLRMLHERGYIDVVPQFHEDGGRAANKYFLLD